MLTLTEAKEGPATLEDVARINQYLDMLDDIQRADLEELKEKEAGRNDCAGTR
jgi:hypothetical protein